MAWYKLPREAFDVAIGGIVCHVFMSGQTEIERDATGIKVRLPLTDKAGGRQTSVTATVEIDRFTKAGRPNRAMMYFGGSGRSISFSATNEIADPRLRSLAEAMLSAYDIVRTEVVLAEQEGETLAERRRQFALEASKLNSAASLFHSPVNFRGI